MRNCWWWPRRYSILRAADFSLLPGAVTSTREAIGSSWRQAIPFLLPAFRSSPLDHLSPTKASPSSHTVAPSPRGSHLALSLSLSLCRRTVGGNRKKLVKTNISVII
jgi:hypothetical protein